MPVLMVVFTRQDRYLPEIEWSRNSWTHNVFRLYELLFWRKVGVKPEISSYAVVKNGQVVSVSYVVHSFESVFALTEQYIREFLSSFKLKPFRIYIPQLITPSGFPVPTSPYLFAIAFDASASLPWVYTGQNPNWSHTCTGSNLVLLGGGFVSVGSDVSSSATYNSVAMTKVRYNNGYNNDSCYLIYHLAGPATGANTLQLNLTASYNGEYVSISFSGASQGAIDSSNGGNGGASSSSPFNLTTTVVAANSMLWGMGRNADNATSGGTNTTLIYNNLIQVGYSTSPVGTGSQSVQFTWSGTVRFTGWIVASVAPAVAAGPTNLKSLDTNVKANIKSYNTNLIANVKSINTNA